MYIKSIVVSLQCKQEQIDMKTLNKTMTIEEATKLYQSKSGMNYLNTEHNRKVMKQVIDSHLKQLREAL